MEPTTSSTGSRRVQVLDGPSSYTLQYSAIVYATDSITPMAMPIMTTHHDGPIDATASNAIFLVSHVGVWIHPMLW